MGQGSFSTTGLGIGAQLGGGSLASFGDFETVPPDYELDGRRYNFVAIDIDGSPSALDAELAELEASTVADGAFAFVRHEQPPTKIRDLDRVRVVPGRDGRRAGAGRGGRARPPSGHVRTGAATGAGAAPHARVLRTAAACDRQLARVGDRRWQRWRLAPRSGSCSGGPCGGGSPTASTPQHPQRHRGCGSSSLSSRRWSSPTWSPPSPDARLPGHARPSSCVTRSLENVSIPEVHPFIAPEPCLLNARDQYPSSSLLRLAVAPTGAPVGSMTYQTSLAPWPLTSPGAASCAK